MRFICRTLLFALISLPAACSKKTSAPVNTDEARQRLRAALDAWKNQESYGKLAERTPAIIFNEPLWQEGVRLLEFELGPVELHGRQGRCTVRLVLQHKDGKKQERQIGYLIDTAPNIVIVREGLGI
jgi:hypothetical protein